MLEIVVQQTINALVLSAMYALIAIGFTLYFGVLGVINISHGDVAMVAAFAALALTGIVAGRGSWLTGVIVVAGSCATCMLLGIAVERVAFRPLRATASIASLLSSVGVSIVLRETVLHLYPNGANPQRFPALFPIGVLNIGDVVIEGRQIIIIGVALSVVLSLFILVSRSRFGRAIRTTAMNKEVAQVLGVNIDVVARRTFILGSLLAGLAGLMNGIYYNSIMFDMGFLLTVKGFTAAVIGGLRNSWGALVGAMFVGFLETFSAGFIPSGSSYKDTIVFSALVITLILRPSGIFAEAQADKV